MIINFRETYKSLSTAELLNIVKEPNDYQPDAVLAAIELLKDRTITHTEISEAERIKENKKDFWIDEKVILHNVSAKIQDLVEPIVTTETKVNTKKWINVLIVTLGIYCAWMLTELIIRWRRLYELNRIEIITLLEIIAPIYLLVTIVGLYKKKKWGWMLLMIYFVLETISFATGIFDSVKYSFLHRQIGESGMGTLAYGLAIYLLSQKDTRTYFNINSTFFRNTIFSGIILFLAIQVFFKYFYA
jgi:hypothetical protein